MAALLLRFCSCRQRYARAYFVRVFVRMNHSHESLALHECQVINGEVNTDVLSKHHAAAYERGSTTLTTQEDVFSLTAEQINFLWDKFSSKIVRDAHGQANPEHECWVLPDLDEEKANTTYTRVHAGVKKPRGPYPKVGYSFSKGYAQTTYTKKDHKTLGLTGKKDFPKCRTFQCTHIALLKQSQLPPVAGRKVPLCFAPVWHGWLPAPSQVGADRPTRTFRAVCGTCTVRTKSAPPTNRRAFCAPRSRG